MLRITLLPTLWSDSLNIPLAVSFPWTSTPIGLPHTFLARLCAGLPMQFPTISSGYCFLRIDRRNLLRHTWIRLFAFCPSVDWRRISVHDNCNWASSGRLLTFVDAVAGTFSFCLLPPGHRWAWARPRSVLQTLPDMFRRTRPVSFSCL